MTSAGTEVPVATTGQRLFAAFWLAVFAMHVVAAAIWWWMMPAGFPIAHPRFFLHRVVPWLILGAATLQLIPHARRARPALRAAIPVTWIAAAVTGRCVFPVTLATLWLAPLMGGLVMLGAWALQHRPQAWRALAVASLPAALLGWFLVTAQQAPPPSTHPANVPMPAPLPAASEPGDLAQIDVTDTTRLDAGRGELVLTSGGLTLALAPKLTFLSRSPDRCWTVFAKPADRIGPAPRLVAVETSDHHVRADYLASDEPSTLDVRADATGELAVEALTRLPRSVAAHLDAFTQLTISGHHQLFLAFSPAPDARIEVKPSDYPSGRPARFAYLDATGTFHVVEATDAEKGPFTDLATGPLARGEPLTITVFDDQLPRLRITLEDFSAQASTELSPTAGWGVPQNALEFSRWGDRPDARAGMFITLAGTSVGRGFDSVSHGPGVYRNRLRVTPLAPLGP